MSDRTRLAGSVLLLAVVVAATGGCGAHDGLDKRYTVSATVTYNGQPLKKGKIVFTPEKAEGRPGGGDVEDGQVTHVTTLTPNDGLLPGNYLVAVTAVEDVDLEATAKKFNAAPDQVVIAKVAATAKSVIPKKYASNATSGLTAEVSPGSRSFTFDLKLVLNSIQQHLP